MVEAGLAGLGLMLRQAGPIPLDATVTCEPAELVALVGPSGSGKTTILRAIAGLYRPRDGRITCNGATWYDTARRIVVPPQQRRVGFVFQDYALFPHLTALGNVALALGALPRGQRAARARELLALVHLAGLEGRYPAQLSGGQRQRVALARALAREPALLLLDEPFSAVDQVTRRKLQRELVQLRARLRIPILLVTHDLDEAAALADRMVVLHRGRTLQDATPAEIMARPRSTEVARLVDLRNLFEGVIAEHRADEGLSLLRWGRCLLEAAHAPSCPVGSRVDWVVPMGSVIMHRRDRPSRGEHENPVQGKVVEFLTIGDAAQIALAIDGEDEPLAFSVPYHVARRNGVAVGETLVVSLLAKDIHIMSPVASDARPR